MPTHLRPDSDVAAPITCLLSDVDGVMTDGRIIYDDMLRETKRFHVRDGQGIKVWLASQFEFGILTARTSPIVAHRASELGIRLVRQACVEKLATAIEVTDTLGIAPESVAYIGDDLPDLEVMRWAGLAVAPADASTDARDAADWVTRCRGGEGVIRELVERLLRAKGRWEGHVPG